MAWIIGWDLILEYAVGNVAVAISWGDYFKTLVRGVGIELPAWLTTGYRTALLSANPDVHGLLQTAPHDRRHSHSASTSRRLSSCMLITWLLLRGAKESARVNNVMVVIKLVALAPVHRRRGHAPRTRTTTRRSRRTASPAFTRARRSSSSPTSASTRSRPRARRRRNPQRNLPIGILGGLAICTLIYVIVGAVLTGMVPYKDLGETADPLAYALQAAGFSGVGWIVALGAAVSMSAVLLVFQYGQPRIFFAMARDGLLPQWAAQAPSEDAHARTRPR